MRNIVVALTGASGVILGIRLLEKLKENEDVRTSLILSEAASQNILLETDYQISEVCVLADAVYDNADFSAPIASGSYPVDTMVVLPCSMKTLSAICHGYDATLIARAGDVTLKERRQLILCPRETPLHAIHLEIIQESRALFVPAAQDNRHEKLRERFNEPLSEFLNARMRSAHMCCNDCR